MTGLQSPHRAWIEIDHAAIRHNLSVVRGLAPDRPFRDAGALVTAAGLLG